MLIQHTATVQLFRGNRHHYSLQLLRVSINVGLVTFPGDGSSAGINKAPYSASAIYKIERTVRYGPNEFSGKNRVGEADNRGTYRLDRCLCQLNGIGTRFG